MNQSTRPRAGLWPTYGPPMDIVFTHGKGSRLYTDQNVEYLDFLSGIAVTALGHSEPTLVAALKEQTDKLWHLSNVFRIPESEKFAQKLCDLSFGDRVFLANSGTEAVEAGLKAIRGYQSSVGKKHKHRIIGFSNSFHGRSMACIAVAGNASYVQDFIPTDYAFDQVEWQNLEQLEKTITEETAGIIIEPVQGEGGIAPSSKAFLQAVRNLCNKHELVLMFDEVQCGMGRTGHLFAYEYYGIEPDVMALAKGIGGGFPLGACVAREKVAAAMVVGTHGSTYGGNPLAAVVGNAVLEVMGRDGFFENVRERGEQLRAGLEAMVEKYPTKLNKVQGLGLMLGLQPVRNNLELLGEFREEKLIVGRAGNNMLRFMPPLNVSSEEIDQCLAVVDRVFSAPS